jgi:uncharacterized protein
VDRLFLDANVLFSAAYREDAGVTVLWSVEHATLVSSTYAIEEARRNLPGREQKQRLEALVQGLEVVAAYSVPDSFGDSVLAKIALPRKDLPIIGGALAAGCSHLITGDVRHFGRYFGKHIGPVLVLPPADYIRRSS